MSDGRNHSLPGLAQNGPNGFGFIFLSSFIVFLLVALVAQTFALQWRPWLPGAEGERSMIGGVKTAVYTFMSHLS
jgi:light-harvesting complex 1 beta chain